jgi:hypothetical protein
MAAVPAGYRLLEAGYYRLADGAGPHAWNGTVFTLLSGDAEAAVGTVPAATHRLLEAGYYQLSDGAGPYGWSGAAFFLLSS